MAGNMIKRGVNIYIDQSEAQKAIEILQLKFQKLTNDMQALENQGKKGSKEWNRLSTNLQKVDADLKEVSSEVKLTELSMKQLESVKARLNAQLRNAIPGSEQWKQYANGIQTCETRLKELRAGARNTDGAINKLDNSVVKHQSSMTKLANSFKKYQALALGFIASITGISYAGKRATEEYTKLEDVFADVRKTTGLAIEEVKELDESLKAYDTRTSREELLKLATEAGKLGITGKEAIEEFVKGGDRIRIALGEDLGKDAILNIGKLASVFGLVDTLGWEGSFNAVGSAINELAQSSSASESYLVQFASRLGGVGAMARISVQDILGYASALDQAGMNVEMSSSAVQQFITKMLEDPAKFAKIAGLEVKSFTELISKDTNAAILKMLEAMKAKGGFDSMIPMFAEMGTAGIRAISVLSSLANGLENVKEAQDVSNNSFAQGVSILDEYNIKNMNDQAELDKRKKRILEYTVALGEKLYPITKGVITATGSFLKLLVFLADNFKIITFALGGLTVSYIAYNAQMIKTNILHAAWIVRAKLRLILMGSETTAVNLATVAQNLWNKSIKANPLGFLIGLLTIATTAFMLFRNNIKATTAEQKALNKVKEDANKIYEDEENKLIVLEKIAKNNKISIEERRKAIQELNKIVPGYNASLDQEGKLIVSNTMALKEYLKELKNKIFFQATQDELTALVRGERELNKQIENQKKLIEDNKSNVSYGGMTSGAGGMGGNIAMDVEKGKLKDLEKLRLDNAKAQSSLNKEMEKYSKVTTKSSSPTDTDIINNTANPSGGADDDKKPWEKKVKALEDNLKLSKAINEKALLEKNINEEQYNRLNLEADELFLQKKLAVLKLHKQATGDVELEIAKNKAELQKLGFNQEIQLAQDAKDQFLLELEIKRQRGEVTENTYNANIIAADVAFMKKRIEIQQKYGDSTIISQTELLRKRKELEASFKELVKTDDEKLVDDPNENPALSENMKLDVEEAILKNKYKNNLINKQEYEDEMEKIAKKRWDNEIGFIEKYFDIAVNSTQKMGEAVSGFKDAELTKAETNYTKEEKALDSKLKRGLISQQEYDTQKNALEEKYQEEQKSIKKKYAGVELVISIGKIIAETALAVMSSFGQLGPIAGIPFAAIMAAVGASQIALATAQYQQIQGLEQGLYPTVTRQQDGKKFKVNSVGNMQTGVYSQPSVLVGEAGPELVVDNKRFNKIMKERPEVINYIVNGFEKGKYPTISQKAINIAKGSGDSKLQAAIDQLLVSINESDIYVLRKKLRKADKTISDINNKFN